MMECDALLLATGGCRADDPSPLAQSLGHTIVKPVPSLFTFNIETPWLLRLAGVTVPEVEVTSANACEEGSLMITHHGLSGPVILRASAWGARALNALDYQFSCFVNWLPTLRADALAAEFQARRQNHGAKRLITLPIFPLPLRLWEQLVFASGLPREMQWAGVTKTAQQQLVQQLTKTEFKVVGKSTNKEEFVTCGGVKLSEVNFKTMESRICSGLHFAGELLDIDGLTGGFNFQAAWTTGWLAGQAMRGS
jgi:predicted Rossmann fold flavoprotein